jgi:hypothetical protein
MAAGLAKEPSAQQHPHHRCTTCTCSTSWPSDTHSRAMAPDLTRSHTNRGTCLLTCQYTVLQHRYNRAQHQTNTSRSCHSALIYHQSSPFAARCSSYTSCRSRSGACKQLAYAAFPLPLPNHRYATTTATITSHHNQCLAACCSGHMQHLLWRGRGSSRGQQVKQAAAEAASVLQQ